MELLKSYLEEPEIYAADISKVRLDFAGKFEDAKPLVVPRSGEGFSKMALRERPEGFDLVIVATGIPEAFGDGLRCVRKSGKLLLFGVPLKDSFHALDLPGFFQNELTLTTSYATTDVEMAQALELLSSRKINVSKFITAKFPLEKITQGMNEARSETQVKVLITR
jgi:threonine dehydrogenase-like Zn-dependent dehydrogenase